MKQALFYTAGDDLMPVIRLVESAAALQYVRCGHYLTAEISALTTGLAIPNLGKADFYSSIACTNYLVSNRTTAIKARPILRNDGSKRFAIDQMLNHDTITLTPAGQWNDNILLHGRVATVSETAPARALMNLFRKAIHTRFTKIKAFYLGPEALQLFRAGEHLTSSDQSPREFYLKAD
jgi:hypothetical protein